MPRRVRLVLCTNSGEVLGSSQQLEIASPWWPDVGPVVDAARHAFGIDVMILRLLTAESDTPMAEGCVSYLAELHGEAPAELALGGTDGMIDADEQPLRAPWARPGGIAATIAWADAALARAGRLRTGPAAQVKSWNLSSVLRLPTTAGDAWCKSVPPFMTDEGTIIGLIGRDDPTLVPALLGADRAIRTALLGDVPGDDQWEAPEARLIEMVHRFVGLQARWAGRVGELLAAGVSDWRAVSLPGRLGAFAARAEVRALLGQSELTRLDALLADLPERLVALAECGLPESLVHGDFHPGNWRYGADGLVLLDWGEAGVGHPMLDFAGSFFGKVPEGIRGPVRGAWLEAWQAELPGANPARAAELIKPIAALRGALVYQGFLDGIEPSEWPYHAADVPVCVRRAVAIA